jgi:hypothetical protein
VKGELDDYVRRLQILRETAFQKALRLQASQARDPGLDDFSSLKRSSLWKEATREMRQWLRERWLIFEEFPAFDETSYWDSLAGRLDDESIKVFLQKRLFEGIKRRLWEQEAPLEGYRQAHEQFWRRPPKISKGRILRYRRHALRGNRNGGVSDFRKWLARTFQFRVSDSTLRRWFSGKRCPSKKQRLELNRVFERVHKQYRISTAEILKKQKAETEPTC